MTWHHKQLYKYTLLIDVHPDSSKQIHNPFVCLCTDPILLLLLGKRRFEMETGRYGIWTFNVCSSCGGELRGSLGVAKARQWFRFYTQRRDKTFRPFSWSQSAWTHIWCTHAAVVSISARQPHQKELMLRIKDGSLTGRVEAKRMETTIYWLRCIL